MEKDFDSFQKSKWKVPQPSLPSTKNLKKKTFSGTIMFRHYNKMYLFDYKKIYISIKKNLSYPNFEIL